MVKEKILVMGGTGYTGFWVVYNLLKLGYPLKIIDTQDFENNSLLQYLKNKDFELLKKDVRDVDEDDLKDIDVVVHLASVVGEALVQKRRLNSYLTNVVITDNLVKKCANKKIIYGSTCSVYGKSNVICTEDSPLNPRGEYGIAKLKAENIVKNSGLDYVILRPGSTFGLSNRTRFDLIINNFIYRAVKDSILQVYGEKTARSVIHIADVARAIIFTIENFNKMKNNIYNLAAEDATKEMIAKLISEKSGCKIEFLTRKEDIHAENYIIDSSKIKKLGFKPIYSLERGLDELLTDIRLTLKKNK